MLGQAFFSHSEGLNAGEVVGHVTGGRAHVGACDDDVAVAGEVFAEIGVLPGHVGETGRIDDDGEVACSGCRVAHCPKTVLERRVMDLIQPCQSVERCGLAKSVSEARSLP